MPQHPPTGLAVTDEVRLRLYDDDALRLLAEATADSLEHLQPWMSWATPEAVSWEHQQARHQERLEQAAAGESYMYLLVEGGHVHGVVGLHRRIGPGGIEIGYWLRPGSVGRGLITRAVAVLTTAALELDDVQRVEIHCDEANVRSAAVPQRLGFRLDRVEDDGVEAPAEVGRGMVWVYPSSTSAPIS
jgi:RimJ/RimL family protein N-acetyltransferase